MAQTSDEALPESEEAEVPASLEGSQQGLDADLQLVARRAHRGDRASLERREASSLAEVEALETLATVTAADDPGLRVDQVLAVLALANFVADAERYQRREARSAA